MASFIHSSNVSKNAKIYYATSSSSGSTFAATISADQLPLTGFALTAGTTVNVRFTNPPTSYPTSLNVNNSGNYLITSSSSMMAVEYSWLADQIVQFTFNGSYWQMVGVNTYVTSGSKSGSANVPGLRATAEGYNTASTGQYAHAEGYGTTASGERSHSEGSNSEARGDASHAEGAGTFASGQYAHAEGDGTVASGDSSHAEGSSTNATESFAHAEGVNTTAEGLAAHAEGQNTTATGDYSHAEGDSTIAETLSQHVFGEYNVADTAGSVSARGDFVEIVGNGTSDNDRSNARTLDWDGNEVLSGKLTVGTAPTSNMDVTTKQYVDTGLSTKQKQITISTSEPTSSDGVNGDIWLVYEE